MNRSLDIGSVLSRAFSTWFSNIVTFTGLALLCSAPILLMKLMAYMGPMGEAGILVANLGNIAMNLVSYLVTGMVVYAVFQSLKGGHASIGKCFQVVGGRFGSIILTAILVGIITTLGFLACIVPGVILALMFAVVIPVVVVERLGPVEALTRSKDLTDGNKVNIFLIYLVYFVVLMCAIIIPTMILGVGAGVAGAAGGGMTSTAFLMGSEVFTHAIQALVTPLFATLSTVIYHDLRVANDGVDVDELLAVFE